MSKSQTTNYKWLIPNDDELVRDGADAIRTLGSSIDASLKAVDGRTVTDPATKSWVTQQNYATQVYSKSLNMAGVGGTLYTGAKILVGTATAAVGGFSTLSIAYPTGVGFTNVWSVTACNGDWNAANGTIHIHQSNLTGFVAVIMAAVPNAAGASGATVGSGFNAGRSVRVNYVVVGV